MQTEQNPEDLLTPEEFHARASTGKRLANYIIDFVFFYVLALGFGVVLALAAPTTAELFTNGSPGFGLLDRVVSLLLYALYMSAVEAIFKGKSLGKLITKTRAINADGSQISGGKAFERGFSRAVPFCVFSALGTPCNPWQDKWTNTMVVDDKD
ncbi:MAG: hypothetical protein JWR61_4891 [Ferruginibacter sp.]|uniref:RDD family protein n=1 Tax=Ferruginibacter sp. TaxID=1940288 RepID=UPI0026586EC7|nr:RDD family protein [Ferruginibacter sp.]MDB5279936.1 hypothetical protein [Ferruginibacter sp.]